MSIYSKVAKERRTPIVMILSSVCLHVWPSVTLYIVALRVGVGS